VRHRDDRHVHAGERPDVRRVHPAGVHDDFRLDLAAVGLDGLDASAPDADAGDARVLLDLGSATACSLREREGELARVDVPVGRDERGAEDAIGRQGREELLRLARRDQIEVEVERVRPPRLARDLLHALL
jgi:hypothetical protein